MNKIFIPFLRSIILSTMLALGYPAYSDNRESQEVVDFQPNQDAWVITENSGTEASLKSSTKIDLPSNRGYLTASLHANSHEDTVRIDFNDPDLTCISPCFLKFQHDAHRGTKYKAVSSHWDDGVQFFIDSSGHIARRIANSKTLSVTVNFVDFGEVTFKFDVNYFDLDKNLHRKPIIDIDKVPELSHMSDFGTKMINGTWKFIDWGTDKLDFNLLIQSSEFVELDYSYDDYNGRDRAVFSILQRPNNLREVTLSLGRAVIKEDFVCLYQCLIAIKFDNEPYRQYLAINTQRHHVSRIGEASLIGANEKSVLTIPSNGDIEQRIARSAQMKIMITIYQGYYGDVTKEYTFNVNNLNVPYLINDYLTKTNSALR